MNIFLIENIYQTVLKAGIDEGLIIVAYAGNKVAVGHLKVKDHLIIQLVAVVYLPAGHNGYEIAAADLPLLGGVHDQVLAGNVIDKPIAVAVCIDMDFCGAGKLGGIL